MPEPHLAVPNQPFSNVSPRTPTTPKLVPLPLETLKSIYAKSNQSHVFQFYDQLSEQEQHAFLLHLTTIDPERVLKIFEAAKKTSQLDPTQLTIQPLPDSIFTSLLTMPKEKQREYEQIGLKAIQEKKVAVVLLAGGQGTRLGSSAPKGCYDIGLPSGKSLFQLQAERLKKLQSLATQVTSNPKNETGGNGGGNVVLPWYIMVSGPTRKETEQFFKSKGYFGLDPNQVKFFEQGTLPAIDAKGQFIMESKSRLSLAPDGNGGLYQALFQSGVLQQLKEQRIQYVHAYCVDNCLVKLGDPIFLGYNIAHQYQVSAKTVKKITPEEPVGVVCLRDQKYSVVEYSELPKDLSVLRDPKTKDLVYAAANIANHFYTVDFLTQILESQDLFPYHLAHKKIPYLDINSGELQTPSQPNGWKMELFIFDVFPFCKSFSVMEVEREWEFSPLKNKTGVDSPMTSRQALMQLHAHYLQQAGAQVQGREDPNFVCEISPLISYAGEGLEQFKGKTLISPIIIQ